MKADKESFNRPFPHFLLWFYYNTFYGRYFPWRRTKSLSIDHFHISYFDSTIIAFYGSYFPWRRTKWSPSMHSSIQITYIFPIICSNFKVVTVSEFSMCYEIIIRFFFMRFKYLQIVRNYSQIRCSVHCFCSTGYHFACRKENNSHSNGIQRIIKTGICKVSIGLFPFFSPIQYCFFKISMLSLNVRTNVGLHLLYRYQNNLHTNDVRFVFTFSCL